MPEIPKPACSDQGGNRHQERRYITDDSAGGGILEFLGNPASFLAAILALPVLWFAKRSLADENDRGGVLAVWFVMAIVVLYLLWYGGMFAGGKF